MQKFNDKEISILLNKVDYPNGLSFSEVLLIFIWSIFNKKKFYYFISKINDGMNLRFAYISTKNYKKIK